MQSTSFSRPAAARALRLVAVALLTLAAAPACRSTPEGNGSEAPAPAPRTTLEVENRSFNDMTVYVLRGSQRLRLGNATGNGTTTFTIPPHLIFGATEGITSIPGWRHDGRTGGWHRSCASGRWPAGRGLPTTSGP
jgi:hypothetical protein